MSVCIGPKWIVDEIIFMYLVHMLCIEFNSWLWWWRDSKEYSNIHMLMDILCIEGFEFLITHTIWYCYCKWCLNIFHCGYFLKDSIHFYPKYFLLEALKYQRNLLVKFWGRGFTSPEYLGWHILQCVEPPMHLVSLIYYVWIFCEWNIQTYYIRKTICKGGSTHWRMCEHKYSVEV